MNDTLFFHFY